MWHDLPARGIHTDPDTVKLGDLFPQGHPGEQITHPLSWRDRRIPPGLCEPLDRHVAVVLYREGGRQARVDCRITRLVSSVMWVASSCSPRMSARSSSIDRSPI